MDINLGKKKKIKSVDPVELDFVQAGSLLTLKPHSSPSAHEGFLPRWSAFPSPTSPSVLSASSSPSVRTSYSTTAPPKLLLAICINPVPIITLSDSFSTRKLMNSGNILKAMSNQKGGNGLWGTTQPCSFRRILR